MSGKALLIGAFTLFALVILAIGIAPVTEGYSVPSGPLLYVQSVNGSQIILNWTAPSSNGSPITGYEIFRGSTNVSEQLYSVVPGSTLTFTDGNVVDGLTYFYYISAVNNAGPGPISNAVYATPMGVPGAPTTLNGVAGNGNITLSWVPPFNNGGSQIIWYRVYRGTSPGSEVFVSNTTNLTYIDTGLASGRTFYYKVSAVSLLGEGAGSQELSVVLPSCPGQVTNLVAVGLNTTVQLSWNPPTNTGGITLSGYQVYRSTTSGAEMLISTVSTPSFSDTQLVNGQIYYYKVNAVNSFGPGGLSKEVNATPTCPPYSPSMLSPSIANGSVGLSWIPPSYVGGSPITGYKVYRGTTPGTQVVIANTTVPFFNDTLLTNGRTYYYRVSAVNGKGEGSRSAVLAATPLGPPGYPTNLTLVPGNSTINISWKAPRITGGGPILYYDVYWRSSSSSPWTEISTRTNATLYVQSGISNGIEYYYKISAVTAGGEGPFTTICSCTPATTPAAPYDIVLEPGDGQMNISWQAPSSGGWNITGYNVYGGSASGSEVFLQRVNSTWFIDNGLGNGTTYYYEISAINGMGNGTMSVEASAMMFSIPGPPQDVTSIGGNDTISLSWDPPSNTGGTTIKGYLVYRFNTSDPYNIIEVADVIQPQFMDGGVVNGINYTYFILAANEIGTSGPSAESSAIPSTGPGSPGNLSGSLDNETIILSWTTPSNNGGSAIIGYDIYRGYFSSSLAFEASIGVTNTFMDVGLKEGTSYYYLVKAVNGDGEGAASSEIGVRTMGPPSPPSMRSCTVNGSSIILEWNPPTTSGGEPILYYDIYRGTATGQEMFLTTESGDMFNDTGLPSGQTFYYAVTAVNIKGESGRSSEVSATTRSVPNAPEALVLVPGNEKVTLSWDPSLSNDGTPITAYLIFRGEGPGNLTLIASVNDTAFIDTNLTNGMDYYYSVCAENRTGEGAASPEEMATPMTVPGAPISISVDPKDGQLFVSWEPSVDGGSNVTSYVIYWSMPTMPWSSVSTYNTSYTITGLTDGQIYLIKIGAVNIVGKGALSAITSAEPIALPGPPTSLQARAEGSRVVLTWTQPTGLSSPINGYIVYRSNSTGVMEYIGYVTNTVLYRSHGSERSDLSL